MGKKTDKIDNTLNNTNSFPFDFTVKGINYKVYKLGTNMYNIKTKCYTYISDERTAMSTTETSNETYLTKITGKYNYRIKTCGEQYQITESKISVEKKLNSDGTTTIKITPIDNDLKRIWNDVFINVNYNGNDINGISGKGGCDNKESYSICTGIMPFVNNGQKSGSGSIVNNPLYRMDFYKNGISTDDFSENVSLAMKNTYVESCGGTGGFLYIGSYGVEIESQDNIMVQNPAVITGTAEYNVCQKIKALNADITRKYVPECYSDLTSEVSYYELQNLEDSLNEKYNSLVQIYSTMSSSSLNDLSKEENLYCDSTYEVTNEDNSVSLVNKMGIPIENEASIRFDSKLVYEDFNKEYWGMVCVEDYYIDGGDPSLVAAGAGFNYYNKVQINTVNDEIE